MKSIKSHSMRISNIARRVLNFIVTNEKAEAHCKNVALVFMPGGFCHICLTIREANPRHVTLLAG